MSDGSAEYAAKRDELVRIAARLFREKGYEATRLGDIATAAGIDRASLYYYIGNKEELFRELIEGILALNVARAEKVAADDTLDVVTRLRQIFEILIASYEENYPQLYVYIQEQMHQVGRQEAPWAKEIVKNTRRFENLVVELISLGIKTGALRDDVPVRLASNAIFGMFNWTHRWFAPGGGLTGGDVARAFLAIFFDGMCKADAAAG